jgi:hypothetical protein
MNRALLDYFRCPDHLAEIEVNGRLSSEEGFFYFGRDTICFGRCSGARPSQHLTHNVPDVTQSANFDGDRVRLPFDFSQVVDNLRYERYHVNSKPTLEKITGGSVSRKIYYSLRPILPVSVRKHLQRVRLRGWEKINFPHWPMDCTVESLMGSAMSLLLKRSRTDKIPFIWFWPDGAASCAIMTHDVEATAGRNFCKELMDLDDSFGVKSAFQIVPEMRYEARQDFLDTFRNRGFEVNVHDLNHDGALFQDKNEFLRRAERINRYSKEFQTHGFRAGAMYRNQDWYSAFDFSYDMSVPNVAHLEPQRGGCCTVMPFFIGDILELPLTTAQDYSLFHILGDYSIDLWKQQIELILQWNGLISFIIHPDYIVEKRAREVYLDLLGHLARLRADKKFSMALPRDVDRWWRSRRQMKLVPAGKTWRIEGPQSERARIAYASLDGERLTYTVNDSA